MITVSDGQYQYHFNHSTGIETKRAKSMFTKEPGTIKWISSFEPNSVFYDVGANVGIYTLYGCKRVKQVYAFEPHLGNCMNLAKNMKLNKATNVKVMSIPLHSKVGFFDFDYRSDVTGSSDSQLDCKEQRFEPIGTEYKYAMTVDSLQQLIKPPNYVKIDVDGNEILILHGMKEVLSNKCIKSLQVELGLNKDEASQFLQNYGYEIQSEHYTARGQAKLAAGEDPRSIVHNVVYFLPTK